MATKVIWLRPFFIRRIWCNGSTRSTEYLRYLQSQNAMNYGFRGLGSNPNVLPIYYKHKNKREMKVTKVLNDTELIVKLEPHDYDHAESQKLNVVIAHDYVQFGRQTSLFADIKCKTPLESNHAICSNVMPMYNEIQIPIRALIEVVLPLLNSNEYCQKEHLVFEGKPQYTCSETAITYYKDGTRMIAVPDGGTFYHIPLSLYESIRNNHS